LQVVAVASRDEEKAKNFANVHCIPQYYASYEQLAIDSNIGRNIFFLYVTCIIHVTNRYLHIQKRGGFLGAVTVKDA